MNNNRALRIINPEHIYNEWDSQQKDKFIVAEQVGSIRNCFLISKIAKNSNLKIKIDETLDNELIGNAQKFNQILTNLIKFGFMRVSSKNKKVLVIVDFVKYDPYSRLLIEFRVTFPKMQPYDTDKITRILSVKSINNEFFCQSEYKKMMQEYE